MKKPMSPTLSFDTPTGSKWKYEIKYDGYRCLLKWSATEFSLISKNGRILNDHFPELIQAGQNIQSAIEKYLPLELDGEIVVLDNEFKGNFEAIQRRGRLRNEETILAEAKKRPVTFCVFDLLQWKGKSLKNESYAHRKQQLFRFFENNQLKKTSSFKYVPAYDSFSTIWEQVVQHDSEGAIAKLDHSKWENGRTRSWLKIKNYKHICCFITSYEKENGYFYVGLWNDKKILPIGLFKHGLSSEEEKALIDTIKKNKRNEDNQFIYVDPSICIEIKYLQFYKKQLREPFFEQFRFDLTYEDCTIDQLEQEKEQNIYPNVEITSPKKIYWKSLSFSKSDYIEYIKQVSPFFLPFLKDRHLTVVRYPNGIDGEAFFQKNVPDYAPSFVDTSEHEGIDYIVCQTNETLLWLANQGAIEFHIPFQTIHSNKPREIVFDLDPHSVDDFHVAVKGALMIKEICDQLGLDPYIKTSGGKGIQIHLPLQEGKYTFSETRIFTSFVAEYLISKEPNLFTVERMKKNRGKRLYVDYIQHAEGKTIIAPYSARGRKEATVATPLFWDEVNEQLAPTDFTIDTIIERLNKKGCPFEDYFHVDQPLEQVIDFLSQKK